MIAVTVYYLNIFKCWKNGASFDSTSNLKFIFVFNYEREKKSPIMNYFTSNFEIDFAGL